MYVYIYIIPFIVVPFLIYNQISMNACKIPTSVVLEHVVIMTMECSMNVPVKMEQYSQEPVPMAPSHVLVGKH